MICMSDNNKDTNESGGIPDISRRNLMKLTGGVGVAGVSTTALGSGGAQSDEDEGQTRKRTNVPAWGVKNTNQYRSAPKYL